MPFHGADAQGTSLHLVILSLGLTSAVLALVTIASCRSFVPVLNFLLRRSPMNIPGYRTFYKFHAYYWWVLGIAILAHAMVAVSHTANDPDASTPQIIPVLGLLSAVSALAVFSSCRIFPRLLTSSTAKRPFSNKAYQSFYKYHSYLWLGFGVLVVVHITLGIIHAGL